MFTCFAVVFDSAVRRAASLPLMLPLAYPGTDFAPGEQLDSLFERSFGDLQFLADEFSKLEVVVAPESETGEREVCRQSLSPRHTRLTRGSCSNKRENPPEP